MQIESGERGERRRWREERPERVAAVDKIEEKRKPEDFIGHRKRGLRWKRGLNVLRRREMLEHPVITEMERWGEIRVRRNVGAAIGRPRTSDARPYGGKRIATGLRPSQ